MFLDEILKFVAAGNAFRPKGYVYPDWNRPEEEPEEEGHPGCLEEMSEREVVEVLTDAVRYYLQVDLAREFQNKRYRERPRLPFPDLWIEFNGAVIYNNPPEISIAHTHADGQHVEFLDFPNREFHLRGLFLHEHRETLDITCQHSKVYNAHGIEGYPAFSFIVEEPWPSIYCGIDNRETRRFAKRLLGAICNLLYFLIAVSENQRFIKVRPEHHAKLGKRLNPLPHSPVPYYILYFQAPCYRYLPGSESTGTHASPHAHRVRGHTRRLTSERFTRDEAGRIREIWIDNHIRGLGDLTEALRVGTVPGSALDYDRFEKLCEGFKPR